jgi:DNA-binding beta-propeller fold protein YncE
MEQLQIMGNLIFVGVFFFFFLFPFTQRAGATEPLVLVNTIEIPNVPEGHRTDHLSIDLKGHRLFATLQEAHAVAVIDLNANKVIYNIPVNNPHAVAYRSDLNKIYVSDDDAAEPGLKIFDGVDYHLIKSVRLLKRTDSMGYDSNTKYLYLANGGRAASLDYSLLSIVNSTTSEVVGEIRVDEAGSLEDMDMGTVDPRLYIAVMDRKEVGVIDRSKRRLVGRWPINKGNPVATAIDEEHHRLFVACRNGQLHGDIVVLDSNTGKEIVSLPIGGLLDYMTYDPTSGRIYAVCSTGQVYVYKELEPDNYSLLGTAETALLARTGLLVPELNRFYVLSPNTGLQQAEVLVFRVQ